VYFKSVTDDKLEHIFQQAENGVDQVACSSDELTGLFSIGLCI
jgi:hypothetical protein